MDKIQPSKPRIGCAWISPDGKFYEVAESGAHGLVAVAIDPIGGCQTLGTQGWIRLYDTGDFYAGFEPGVRIKSITQAQLDVLFDLSQLEPKPTLINIEEEFVQTLKDWLDWYCRKE